MLVKNMKINILCTDSTSIVAYKLNYWHLKMKLLKIFNLEIDLIGIRRKPTKISNL
jgi:hypothetical protein